MRLAWFPPLLIALLASCATAPRLQVRDTPADYQALGLQPTVAAWEDGRRTPRDPRYYEWWYFDALLDDGTTVVVWFGDNWFYGNQLRVVNVDLTPPGQPTRTAVARYTEPGTFATDRADVRLGPHRFEGDLDRYTVTVDAQATGGLGCALQLVRTAPSWRPGTGSIASGDRFFAWLPSVPNGEVTGTLTIDGKQLTVHGSGYHDHNWGNVSPAELMDSWWWGRAVVGDHTFIISELRAKAALGGGKIPLLFASGPSGLAAEGWTDAVHFEEAPPTAHPDPQHPRPIGASVSARAPNGWVATLPISSRMLTSADLLGSAPGWKRLAAGAMGLHPWYTRFESPATLTRPGAPTLSGPGTLEYFEFQ